MNDTSLTSVASVAQVELFPELSVPDKKSSKSTKPSADVITESYIAEMVPDKTPDAFKTISEAAVILSLPQYVLRFWESKFKQIKPLKMRGGRRYYRPEDIETLQTIKNLLYKEGYTIKGARKAFESMHKKGGAHAAPMGKRKPAPKRAAPLLQPMRAAEPKISQSDLAKQLEKKKQLANLREELKVLRDQLARV
jgi:DNA-binding transcriptional MerR regulator